MAAFRAIGVGAVLWLAAPLPSAAQQVVDLYGVTEATLQWSAASGQVAGYYVIVAKNGGTPALYGVSTDTREAVQAAAGDTVTVQVAAFDASGIAGPVSPASDAIRFNALPGGGGGGGTGGDPTNPPSNPDPTPDPAPDPTPEVPDPPGVDPMIAVRMDYTGDGFSDLLLRNPNSGALTLWTMQGAQVQQSTGLAHLPYPWIAEGAGDFDGDANSDILWRNDTTGQLIVWLMHEGAVAGGGGVALPGFKISRSWKVDGVGDFDGDGREDIAVARRTLGLIEILFMNGSTLASRATRKAPSPDWQLIAAPDADGDGVSELVWRNNSTYEVRIESMAAPGQTFALLPARTAWRVLGSGDFDGDGRQDLLVRNNEKRVHPLLLNGARATLTAFSGALPDRTWSLRGVGDFDGDGRADAFWSHETQPVQIWFTGASSFSAARVSSANIGMVAVGEDED